MTLDPFSPLLSERLRPERSKERCSLTRYLHQTPPSLTRFRLALTELRVTCSAGLPDIRTMKELIFVVEEALEGGYTARALGASIFTDADDLQALHTRVRDAVQCHFGEAERPKLIRLHFVREEFIPV